MAQIPFKVRRIIDIASVFKRVDRQFFQVIFLNSQGIEAITAGKTTALQTPWAASYFPPSASATQWTAPTPYSILVGNSKLKLLRRFIAAPLPLRGRTFVNNWS
jgi:hypothetical protein